MEAAIRRCVFCDGYFEVSDNSKIVREVGGYVTVFIGSRAHEFKIRAKEVDTVPEIVEDTISFPTEDGGLISVPQIAVEAGELPQDVEEISNG
jgi:hypothetical protein